MAAHSPEDPISTIPGQIATNRLLPVVTIEDAAAAPALGEALRRGGLPCAEITLRTPAAEDALKALAANDDLLVGAGTVLNEKQAGRVIDLGARFVVTPGFSLSVVRHCQARGIPVFPGIATSTELMMALDAGIDTVKFFPAERLGGLATLKALAQPFGMVKFIPTGGVSAANVRDYLAHPSVPAAGGSWMVPVSLINGGRFDEIERLTTEAAAIATGDTD
ncbi:MAG: bifunctional 4-hydroxy-2-oxoglutarate aldolase/2-dehydro-3-deoxy-phosphogluconate aldolase [Streptosporangiales bacterium]|nr:bifunctional 4-hydroxy-2-oxoglutarate aldolase/2-dehydro-3-deoxy-phosphogluconate aldolase [Streptosporangiales bacterium]